MVSRWITSFVLMTSLKIFRMPICWVLLFFATEKGPKKLNTSVCLYHLSQKFSGYQFEFFLRSDRKFRTNSQEPLPWLLPANSYEFVRNFHGKNWWEEVSLRVLRRFPPTILPDPRTYMFYLNLLVHKIREMTMSTFSKFFYRWQDFGN